MHHLETLRVNATIIIFVFVLYCIVSPPWMNEFNHSFMVVRQARGALVSGRGRG